MIILKKNEFRCAGCDDISSRPCIQIPLDQDESIGYCLFCAKVVLNHMQIVGFVWDLKSEAKTKKKSKRKKS